MRCFDCCLDVYVDDENPPWRSVLAVDPVDAAERFLEAQDKQDPHPPHFFDTTTVVHVRRSEDDIEERYRVTVEGRLEPYYCGSLVTA